MEKILIVEDDHALQETLADNLKHQGYHVETARDGSTAIEIARKSRPDLIMLDIILPGMDGLEVCRILRKEMSTPVLMLTGKDTETDPVMGLEAGADDTLVKPFSMRELLARIKALFRRVRTIKEELEAERAQNGSQVLDFDNLSIDLVRREVRLDSRPLALKPKEFALLLFMSRHLGQVLSRSRILEQVWGWDYIGDSRTVDVHIRWLRKKIEIQPAEPARIITVRGAGYRFEG